MPRQTRKWVTACELADRLRIEICENQETVYSELNEAQYYWQSDRQDWILINTPADAPTELIKVRVWSDHTKVEGAAYQLRLAMEDQGYKFVEQSERYKCRPPKQLESRIYMTFR
jgi:hypothetical protein